MTATEIIGIITALSALIGTIGGLVISYRTFRGHYNAHKRNGSLHRQYDTV